MVKYLMSMVGAFRRPSGSPTWTVYGWRPHGLDFTGKVLKAGVHKERCTSEADAVSWLMRVVLKHGVVHAVVVKLDHGNDVDGERHVVYRVGDGQPWY